MSLLRPADKSPMRFSESISPIVIVAGCASQPVDQLRGFGRAAARPASGVITPLRDVGSTNQHFARRSGQFEFSRFRPMGVPTVPFCAHGKGHEFISVTMSRFR